MSGFGRPWNRNNRQNRNRQTRNLPQSPWMINPPWLGGSQMDDFIPPAPDPPIISNQRDVQTQDYLPPPPLIPSNSYSNIDYASDNVYFDNFSSHNSPYIDYPPPPILEPQQYSATYPSKPPQQYISYPLPIKYQPNQLPNNSNTQEINTSSQTTSKSSNQKKSPRGKSSSDTKSEKSHVNNRKQSKSSYHSSSWSNNKNYTSRLPSPPPPPTLTPQVPVTSSKSPRSTRKEQTSRTLKSRNTRSKDKPTKSDKSDKKKSSTIKPLSAAPQTATKKPSDKLPTKLDKNTILKLVNSTTKYEPAMQKLLREQRSQLTQNLRNKYNEKQNTTSANTSSNTAGTNEIDDLIPADEIIPNFTVDLIEELKFLTDVIESDSNTIAEELKANIKEDKSCDDKLILLDEWTETKKDASDVEDIDDADDGNVTNGDGNDYDMGPIELPSNIDELQLPTDVSSFFNFTEINKDPDLDQTDIETFNSVHIVDKENIGTCPNLVSTTLSPIKKDAMSELINNIALDDNTKLVSDQHVMFPVTPDIPLINGADDLKDDITLTQVVEHSEPPIDVLNNNEHQDKVNKSDETLFFANKEVESERSSLKHSLDNFRQTLRSEILNTVPHVPKRASANKIYNKSASNHDPEPPEPPGVCIADDKIDNARTTNESLNTNTAICESKCNFMNIDSGAILNEKLKPVDVEHSVDEVDHVFTKSTNQDGNNILQADQLVNAIDKDTTDKSDKTSTKNDKRNIKHHDLISSEPNFKVLKIKLEKLDDIANFTTVKIKQNFTTRNIEQNLTTENLTTQNVEENLITQNIEEKLTTQRIGENLTTQNIQGNLTIKNIEENLTTQNVEENLITQNIEENLTAQNTEESLTTQSTEENLVTPKIEENLTIQNTEENLATQNIEENLATQNIEENLTTQNMEDNLTTRNTEETLTIQKIEENLTTQNTEETFTIQKIEENLTTQNIEQKDSTKPDAEMSKEKLQMSENKGDIDDPDKEIENIKDETVPNQIFSQPEILSEEHQSALVTNDLRTELKIDENVLMEDVLKKETGSNLTQMKFENEHLNVKIDESVKISCDMSQENATNISEIIETQKNIANSDLNSEIKINTTEITLAENVKCENTEHVDIKSDTHVEDVEKSEQPNLLQEIPLTNHQLTNNVKDLKVTVQIERCTDIEMTETPKRKFFETPQVFIKNVEAPVKAKATVRKNVTDQTILNKKDKKLRRIQSKQSPKSKKSKALKRKKLLKMLKNLEKKQMKIMAQKQIKKAKPVKKEIVKKEIVKNEVQETVTIRQRTPERMRTPTPVPLTNEFDNVSTSNNIVNRKWRSPGEKKIIQSSSGNEHLYVNQNVFTTTVRNTPRIPSVATSSSIEKPIMTASTATTISQESPLQPSRQSMQEILMKLYEIDVNIQKLMDEKMNLYNQLEIISKYSNCLPGSSNMEVDSSKSNSSGSTIVPEKNIEANEVLLTARDVEEQNTNQITCKNEDISTVESNISPDSFKELQNSQLINRQDLDASVVLSKELENSQSMKKENLNTSLYLSKEIQKSQSLNKKVSSDSRKELKNSQPLNRKELDTSSNPPKELKNSQLLIKENCGDSLKPPKRLKKSQLNKENSDAYLDPAKELQNSQLVEENCNAAFNPLKEPEQNLDTSLNHSKELQKSQLLNEGKEKIEEKPDTSSNSSKEAQNSEPPTEENLDNSSNLKELENTQPSTNVPKQNNIEEIPEETKKIPISTQNQPVKVEPKSTNDNKTEKTIESVSATKKTLRPTIVRRKAETENEDEGKIKPVTKKSKASAFKKAFKDKNSTQMESSSNDDLQAKSNNIFTPNKTNFGSLSFNKKSKNYLRQKSTEVTEDHTKEVNVKKDSRSNRKRKLLVIDDSSDAESVVSQGSLTKISRRTPQNPLKSTQFHIESSDTESVLSHCSTNSKTKQSESIDRKIREASVETKSKPNRGRKARTRTPSKSAKTGPKSEDKISESKESDKTNQYDFLKPCMVALTPLDIDVLAGKNHTSPHKSPPTRITTASDENSHSEFEDAAHDLIVLDEVGFETDDSSTKDIKNDKMDTTKSETSDQNSSDTSKEIVDDKIVKLSNENLKFQNHKGSILHVKLYESYLIAAGEDGNLYKYDINSGKLMATGKGHWEAITCFVIPQTKNSVKHIYSGSLDAHFRSFNLKTLSAKMKFKVDSSIQCMDSDWGYIFIGTISGHMYRYSLEQSNFVDEKRRIGSQTLLALKATREGGRRVLIVAPRNEMVSIRDAMTGLLLRYLSFTSVSYTIYSVLLCDSVIYCGTSQKMILAYNFTDGRNLAHMTAGKGVVCLIEYKKLLFAGCYDGNIYVFDLKTRENVVTLPGPGSMVLALDVTDNKIIVGCKNSSLEVIQMPEIIQKYINDR